MSETKLSTVDEVSAGGVVFRETNSGYEIAIAAAKSNGRWQLPKGLIDARETSETAALREVREEAGINADLIRKIDVIEYWYVGDHKGERARIHKFVHFFLMQYVSGDVKDHDDEVAEARWVKIEEALEMLAFEGEKSIVEQASKLIEELK